jgi:hypothetical protein
MATAQPSALLCLILVLVIRHSENKFSDAPAMEGQRKTICSQNFYLQASCRAREL